MAASRSAFSAATSPQALPLQLCDRLRRVNKAAQSLRIQGRARAYAYALLDRDAFKDDSSTLRQVHYDSPRRTELFIVMMMYNEDDTLSARTMHGYIGLSTQARSRKTWGKDCWKGWPSPEINSRTLSAVAAYQERIPTDVVNGKPGSVHICEYTTQIAVTEPNKTEGAERIIFCLKEKNEKKISHCLFFNAFGHILQPHVCVLLDIGMRPGPGSIYHLWKGLDINSNVGDA
ncbi:chitin synthase-domain-containing protein [Lactarius akahatsu]|uniref:Chitin synthase n=1 Tax=Lactarius akahatsu TaxID=416441 RepID=A0AAD4Q8A4_9AGAM|nr:chitin synthase-domain-containing protein [Lactarius akahatsu]